MVSVRTKLRSVKLQLTDRWLMFRSRRAGHTEADRAAAYWSSLRTYHHITEVDPTGHERSAFLAETVLPELGIESLLEVGANTGRNLAFVKRAHPHIRVCGTDINPRAIEAGRKAHPEIEFKHQNANAWAEPPDTWDAILTMSVLDHIPDDAVEAVADGMVSTASKYVIAVELWDGSAGERGPYKYSRDTRNLFERRGVRTVRWEESPGQYDREHSLLWLYVGAVGLDARS